MIKHQYGMIFRQIREQKMLPLSYFEKVGIKKSAISKFERGASMMSFEKIYTMLEAMDISLEYYELLLNHFSPPFLEEFLQELEEAEIHQKDNKLKNLYEEATDSSNYFLALIVKSKITTLTMNETQRTLEYLIKVRYWGYFELSLLQSILDTISLEDSKILYTLFESKTKNYRGIFKFTRKVHQIAYHFIFILSSKGEQEFAEKILSQIITIGEVDFDFLVLAIRRLVIGFMDYCFKNTELGLKQIEEALSLFKHLGGDDHYCYYRKKIDTFIGNSTKN